MQEAGGIDKFEGKEANTDWFASSASALSYLVLCVKM